MCNAVVEIYCQNGRTHDSVSKAHTSNHLALMSIIDVSEIFRLVCDNNGVNYGTEIWLLCFVVRKTSLFSVNSRLHDEHIE